MASSSKRKQVLCSPAGGVQGAHVHVQSSDTSSQQPARDSRSVQQPASPHHKKLCTHQPDRCHLQTPRAQSDSAAATLEGHNEAQHTCSAAAGAENVSAPETRDDELRRFFKSWAWKREHRPDRERFQRPYLHNLTWTDSRGVPNAATVSIKQQKFTSEGFASTVWDSSIVVAKYLEKLGPSNLAGKRCLDLSAGCGLVGVIMAKLGADVMLTDLAPNLPLLRHNCKSNGVTDASVLEHRWGTDITALGPPFHFIVACDVMYVDDLVSPLVQSLLALSDSRTVVLVAHGRNRPAEPAFQALAASHFHIKLVPGCELDEVYQCTDVDVLRMTRRQQPEAAAELQG